MLAIFRCALKYDDLSILYLRSFSAFLYSLSLSEQIRNFGWQDETASIVSLEELDHQVCCFLWCVFLNEVTRFRYDCELEFACT